MNVNITLTVDECRQVYKALCREDGRQVELAAQLRQAAVRDYQRVAEKVYIQMIGGGVPCMEPRQH